VGLVSELKVTPFYEGGEFTVRGTEDVDAAREAVKAWERASWAEDPDEWRTEDELKERLERIDSLTPRVGWYRWNPCHESSCYDGGGHSGHLGYCDGPGRGRWRGVYFQ
jgi:hypothetical protein